MEIPEKERGIFEDQIINDGFVEFSGYSFEKDECDFYIDERVECAWFAYLQAYRRAKAQAVPEGFVVVPKEPTLEMCHRGRNTQSFKVKDIYKAMISEQE